MARLSLSAYADDFAVSYGRADSDARRVVDLDLDTLESGPGHAPFSKLDHSARQGFLECSVSIFIRRSWQAWSARG